MSFPAVSSDFRVKWARRRATRCDSLRRARWIGRSAFRVNAHGAAAPAPGSSSNAVRAHGFDRPARLQKQAAKPRAGRSPTCWKAAGGLSGSATRKCGGPMRPGFCQTEQCLASCCSGGLSTGARMTARVEAASLSSIRARHELWSVDLRYG